MYKKFAILGLFVALSLPVGCKQNERTANLDKIDDQIEAKLDSQNLKDVDADVKDDGRVELTGTVENDGQRRQAEQTVRGVSGVRAVDNLIKVKFDEHANVNDKDDTGLVDRTKETNSDTGTLVDKDKDVDRDVNKNNDGAPNDTWVSFKTKLALYADRRVPGNDINVESHNGIVSLVGKVPDAQSKAAAVEVARKIDGVKDVKDQIQVVPSSLRKVVDDKDENITDAVENAFDKDKSITDLNLDVVTNNGVVTLTGTADNMKQVEQAIKAAYAVKGVHAVNANAVVINDQNANKKVSNTETQKDKKKSGGY